MTDDNLNDTQQQKVGWDTLETNIWNAAIEAAALIIDRLNREGPYQSITGATEIRKLKK